jgi:transcriptional regulator with XRE-family HTH domain
MLLTNTCSSFTNPLGSPYLEEGLLTELAPPPGDAIASERTDFAERLKAAIERKGWSLSETARQTSTVLGAGARFGRAHVWHYLHGRAIPRKRQLVALSEALEVPPHELLGSEIRGVPQERDLSTSIIRAEEQGDGTVLLEVSQRVAWSTALKVVRALDPARAESTLARLGAREPEDPV